MSRFYNLARVVSATTGTGTLTLGAAASGCLTFAQAGVQNGDVVHYGISDGAASEVGVGTYTASGTTLSRDTVINSTNSGNKINCSGNQQVFITPLASDIEPLETLIGDVRHKQLWISSWKPTLTNGCGARSQIEIGTNKNVYDYAPFDPSTAEYAYANVAMPDDYTGGAVYAKFYFTHPTGTGTVKFKLSGVGVVNDGTLDVAQGTAVGVTTTGGTANDLYISALSAAITPGGTLTAGTHINWKIQRDVDNDTLAVDAYLLGVMIWYPVA